MIGNYLKIAYRNLYKNKGFTVINIAGLTLGLATWLLIVAYVIDELSYDRFNAKSDRIYRVNTDLKAGGTETHFAITAPAIADAMITEFPEVERAVKMSKAINIRFKNGNENVAENNVIYTDPGIFEIFTLPLIYGDQKTALKDPEDIVISRSAAEKYFNKTDVVGQKLFLATDSSTHKITGVINDMPVQSHFKADFSMPLANDHSHSWTSFSPNTYVLLKPGTSYKTLESKLPALMTRKMSADGFNYGKFAKSGNFIKLSLTALTDIHLQSNRQRELAANGNIQYIYIFSAIAIFILLLACINFMNLSTARSTNRAREVGVRKVLGSSRYNLIAQFLTESVLVTIISGVFAFFTAWLLMPIFNQLSGKQLAMTFQTLEWLLPSLLGITLFVGICAGAYPAFFLSSFQPVNVLKGKLAYGFKGGVFRNILVVFQFSISIFLIIGTLVVYGQLNYIHNKDLGFNRNQVLIIQNANALKDPEILKRDIKQIAGVKNATLTSYVPTGSNRWQNELSQGTQKSIQTELWPVDEDYLNTMGMHLLSGRNFSKERPTDSSAMIVNQTAAKMLGFTGDPLKAFHNGKTDYHIIGVVKDFNFNSLRDNVTPLVLVKANDWMAALSVKVNTGNLTALMAQIETKWKALMPQQHFEYSFMDDDFDALYSNEQRMARLSFIFTALAIMVACLGLFGLAAYAAEQRNKEISIRKISGAGVHGLVAMLSKDFIKLVVLSILIATPAAWLIMYKWLEGFAYRQPIQWWIFVVAAVGVILVAFITISFQCLKAAITNPVKSLRSE